LSEPKAKGVDDCANNADPDAYAKIPTGVRPRATMLIGIVANPYKRSSLSNEADNTESGGLPGSQAREELSRENEADNE